MPDKSIFAELLVDVLAGRRKIGAEPGFVTGNELGEYLKKEVVKYREGKQNPQNGTVVIKGLDSGDVVFRIEEKLLAVSKP